MEVLQCVIAQGSVSEGEGKRKIGEETAVEDKGRERYSMEEAAPSCE